MWKVQILTVLIKEKGMPENSSDGFSWLKNKIIGLPYNHLYYNAQICYILTVTHTCINYSNKMPYAELSISVFYWPISNKFPGKLQTFTNYINNY